MTTDWKDTIGHVLVELREGGNVELFVDDGSWAGDASAKMSLDDLVRLGHWAQACLMPKAEGPINLGVVRALKHAEDGTLTSADTKALLQHLKTAGELGTPMTRAEFNVAAVEMDRRTLLKLAWRQHVRIRKLAAARNDEKTP